MIKRYLFQLLIAFILNFSNVNCARYSALPLDNISFDTVVDSSDTDNEFISFNYKVFNHSDCSKYLGRSKILAKGYQPIQISINNNSERSLYFNLDNFSFPHVSYDEVSRKVHFNTAARVVGWTIGAFFIFPLVIGAIVEGIQTPEANDNLIADYARKSLTNQVIKPFSSINGLVFVRKNDFRSKFSFSLQDSKTNQLLTLSTAHPELDLIVK